LNEGELVGGALFGVPDPERAGEALLGLLLRPQDDPDESRRAGFDPDLVRVLRKRLPRERQKLEVACACGVAWVLGRQSSRDQGTWEAVMSLAANQEYPVEVRRGTAETLVGIMTEAKDTIQLVAPFVDDAGIGILAPAIAAATARGVMANLIFARWTDWEKSAAGVLRREAARAGDLQRITIMRTREPSPWPHLKVAIVDGLVAYVGSANVTGAGLGGRNMELGVLLRGKGVSAVAAVLDLIDAEPVPA